MKRPDWFDKPPDQWPPEVRTFFSISATIAERRLRRMQAETSVRDHESTAD